MDERVFVGLHASNIITIGLVVLFWWAFLSLLAQAWRAYFPGA